MFLGKLVCSNRPKLLWIVYIVSADVPWYNLYVRQGDCGATANYSYTAKISGMTVCISFILNLRACCVWIDLIAIQTMPEFNIARLSI